VPQVVVPLFSIDQWENAAAVERAGAGVALDAERATRSVLGRPGPATLEPLGAAVQRVLDDPSHRREARRVADAMRALPPVGAAVDALVALTSAGTKPH
jgi:UDP:flavonoid glycosyltransferase YjiC (YdhE family)